MRVSEERQGFYIAEIRNITIKNPGISIAGICDILKEKNLPLDKNYVLKLRNKVEKKRERVINLNSVRAAIMEMEEINLSIKDLWQIIDGPLLLVSTGDRIMAHKTLTEKRRRFEELTDKLGGVQKDLGVVSMQHILSPELELIINSFKIQFKEKTQPVKYEEAITKEKEEIKKDDKPANPNIQQLPGGGTIDTKGPAITQKW